MSFGIVLSGGGAKGAAHVGVLKALEENNLIPSSVAGASIGAIVGGLYSIGYNAFALEKTLKHFSKNYSMLLDPCYPQYVLSIFQLITNSTITMSGLLRGNKIEAYLKKLTKNKKISQTNMRFIATSVDLKSAKTIAYTNNIESLPKIDNLEWRNDAYLYEIMRASSALPAIFYPKKLNNYLLIDGGISNNLPIDLLYLTGEKNILAVNLTQKYEKTQNTGLFEITMHSLEIMQLNAKSNLLGKEKYLLNLTFPEEVGLMDFKHIEKYVKLGYNTTNAIMPQLKLLFSSN